MNALDSARIGAALLTGGLQQAECEAEADIVFINSCIVTGRADRQSRQEAYRVEKQGKQLAVFGCGPRVEQNVWQQRFPQALVFQEEKDILAHFGIAEEELEYPLAEKTRLPVAIQTGCDNKCTFCITRIARGSTVDFKIESIIRQIKRAEDMGVQEVVLTGIQLASWGCTDSAKQPLTSKLPDLLNTILEQTKIPRIRMSSLGPQFLDDRFFAALKNPRICDHLHLSVQSGSPTVLRRMNRGHGIEEVYQIAKQARVVRPHIALTCDLIVGFPGETEAEFQETGNMAEKIGFAKLHVFPFSPRQGTGAANFPDQVLAGVKKERARKLREQGDLLNKLFIQSQLGSVAEVLAEDRHSGLSSNYIRLKTPLKKQGQIVKVKVLEQHLAMEHSW